MNENQRKWLLYLQSKGVKFEIFHPDYGWENGSYTLRFCGDPDTYRIHAQPIPDIPDWREVCIGMYAKGIKFEMYNNYTDQWVNAVGLFDSSVKRYQIPQQPIPEWREEMTEEKIFSNLRITDADLLEKIDQYMKDHPDSVIPVDEAQIARITELVKDVKIDEETKPDQKEETPHLELQIQWHEDMLHHLRTGELMPVWEYRIKNGDGEWKVCHDPHFSEKYEYRRKPKEIAYYHCVISRLDKTTGLTITGVVTRFSKDDLESYVRGEKFKGQSTKLGPIVETTVEMDD